MVNYKEFLRKKIEEILPASDCIQCGGCEAVCPQHLEIRSLLTQVAAEFEK